MALNLSDLPGKWTINPFFSQEGEIGLPGLAIPLINQFAENRMILVSGFWIILLPKEHFHEFGPYPNTQEHLN